MLLCIVLSKAPSMSLKAAIIDGSFAKFDSIFCTIICRADSDDLPLLFYKHVVGDVMECS